MTLIKWKQGYLAFVILMVCFNCPVYGNVAVPLIFLTLPLMAVALIPIVGLESYILISQTDTMTAWGILVVTIANLTSTVIGIPVTWMVLGGLAVFTEERLFLAPFDRLREGWIPQQEATMLALLVPYFLASLIIEQYVAAWILGESEQLTGAILTANLASYGVLALYGVSKFVSSVRKSRSGEIR